MMSSQQNVTSLSFFQFMAKFGEIQKPDSGHLVCKTYILLIVTFYLTKTENL